MPHPLSIIRVEQFPRSSPLTAPCIKSPERARIKTADLVLGNQSSAQSHVLLFPRSLMQIGLKGNRRWLLLCDDAEAKFRELTSRGTIFTDPPMCLNHGTVFTDSEGNQLAIMSLHLTRFNQALQWAGKLQTPDSFRQVQPEHRDGTRL